MKKYFLFAFFIWPGLWALAQQTPEKPQPTVNVDEFDLEDLVGADTTQALKKNYVGNMSRQSISTATKVATRMDNIPTITEVITAAQIEQRGYRHLADVLNDLANNHQDRTNWGIGEPVSQNVGFGLRFDTGQNILILFNGQRLNGFLYGNRFGGEEYLLSNIDRIEIIRGTGSSLYGANAFTCVVNIISRTALEGTNRHAFEIGALGNFSAGGGVASASGATRTGAHGLLSGALRYGREAGQRLLVENTLFGDQTLRDALHHALDAEVFYQQSGFRAYSKLTRQSRSVFTGFNGVTPNALNEATLSMFAYSVGADYTKRLSPRAELKAQAGWHRDNWREVALVPIFQVNATGDALIRDGQGNPILDQVSIIRQGESINTSFLLDGQGATTESIDGELQFTYKYNGFSNLVSGLYINHDRIVSAERPSEIQLSPAVKFLPFRTYTDPANNWLFDLNATRLNMGLYTQIDYELGKRFLFNAGARYDLFSGTGQLNQNYTAFNPRGGLIYINKKTGNLKLMYGQAFRAPNAAEALSSVTILGSPLNRPEEIRMIQFQWSRNWGRSVRTELGSFHARVKNALRTDANISEQLAAQAFVGQFVNVPGNETTQSNGIDGKLNYKVERLDWEINFTQLFSTNDGSGQPIAYVPKTMVNTNLYVPLGWFRVHVGANYRGNFTKTATDSRPVVRDYVLMNARLVAKLNKLPWEFSLSARNLTNSHVRYPSSSTAFTNHFPARRREIMVGIVYRVR
jgi:iron complex outermembrane receptor protein